MLKTESSIIDLIMSEPKLMEALEIARSFNLPNWAIAAGVIRNLIWDELHGYKNRTPWVDIDLVYYDKNDINESTEKIFEKKLKNKLDLPWSVKNQARMGQIYCGHQYLSTQQGIASFVETATAIGIHLNNIDKIGLIAPYGIEDLINLVLKPVSINRPNLKEIFLNRINQKQWLIRWPKLRIEM